MLIIIALLALLLNGFGIWKDQNANAYYTAAVTSMLQSFSNFFFASFDPGGYVTVDKPPVTFWIQSLSASIFGVHGWSVILPQALAGVGSVLLMYSLVKPAFGRPAGLLASLVMACTPIAVAVSRTNNVDSLLVFTLLVAVWMLVQAVRGGKWGWVIGSFAVIGVAFNIKMLQAYMIVPALYVLYLLAFRANLKKKLAVLAAASAIMLSVSVSWAVVADNIVSKEDRPYIGSSQTNSVLELAFGYNGINRLTGKGIMGGGNRAKDGGGMDQRADEGGYGQTGDGHMARATDGNGESVTVPVVGQNAAAGIALSGKADASGAGAAGPDGPPQGFAPGRGGAFGTGQAGPLRLFQSELSGQISWLLPFAAFASVALLAGIRRRKPLTTRQQMTLFWLAWLLPGMAFFSVAGFFHQYYLIMLAPPIAALVGAGWTVMWHDYRNKAGWIAWLLPASVLATTAFEMYVLLPYSAQIGTGWYLGVGAAGAVCSFLLLLPRLREKLVHAVSIAAMLALLAAPLYWASTPLLYGGNSVLPEAGPNLQQTSGRGGQGMGSGTVNAKLLEYVTSHNTGEKYLFGVSNATSAAPYIIQTGKAVMAMGGFSGSDPIMTVDKLKQLVANKEIKYVQIGGGAPGGGSSELTEWIRSNAVEVPKDQWQDSSGAVASPSGRAPINMDGGQTLYEIQS
ncbi:ArnT family glycosyltransferase [Paenibacillus thalictri]|uniref:Glycosyltransferase family 39 protein n=1 Tax=Paenibacillus thalictri TaxID=2527873 RepID=A0A4Q9DLA8_9BACL|nr:glycosyltransferase family 39 protein [Paenibacillus thalictri]TBL75799.1 glycosyltransferase family 39 protein [Paenibacillus thalictri]